MFPMMTRGDGKCVGFPDVCKVPAPPAPLPVPMPFPNVGMMSSASAGTCSQKVKVLNKPPILKSSEISSSKGDEPGTLKGMVSNVNMDKISFKTASSKVEIEGKPVVTVFKTTAHNGSNANMPAGTIVAPSQSKVIIG